MLLLFIICIILFIPIFLNINVLYLNESKKIYFSFSIFKRIVVIGGSISLIKEGVVINYKNNKAKIFEYKQFFGIKQKFKTLKDFHLLSLSSRLEYGSNNFEKSIIFGYLYVWHNDIICNIINKLKNYISLDNQIYIYEKKTFSLLVESIFVFNLFSVILYLLKQFVGGVYFGIKQKKG